MKSDIPAAELPTISSGDAGKALVVNSGETGVEWATVGGSSTELRVITVNLKSSNTAVDETSVTADDKAYLVNAFVNGFENYPFVIKANYSTGRGYAVFYPLTRFASASAHYSITTQCLLFNDGRSKKQIEIGFYENPYSYKAMYLYDDENIQSKLTAGTGINITNNVISSTVTNPFPECPTTEDSTFQLQCVVSNGVPTYSWVDIIPHPILTNFWLGLNDTEIIGTGDLQGDVDPDDKYVFTWDGTLSQAISDQAEYSKSIEVECGEYQGGDSGNCMFSWDSEEDCWVSSDGPSTISIIPEGGVASATSCEVIVVFDPNWKPLTAPDILNIVITDSNEVNIVNTAQGGASYEHPVVPISGEIGQDGKYHYTLGTADNTLIVDGNDFATANNPYSFVLTLPEGNRGASDASLTSSADPDWDYTLEGGPDKFFFKAVGDCEYVAELVFDPNWTPSE